ncbi:ABC transporter permease [Thaumasiovibrio subtropicus]|uniref:ABC transporter permease n=1 Tax=Thaumasiovibrio subtropicus TaxID=1891207 RepID=UPI000B354B6D|nr:ABC transporter permease [Thaumasiovibrio subtropicus]
MLCKLAWRNIWRQKRRTLLTAGSIATTLLLVLLMRGLQEGSYSANIDNSARFHTGLIQLQHPDFADSNSIDDLVSMDDAFIAPTLQEAAVTHRLPRIESFALAAAGERSKGAMIFGMTPSLEIAYSGIDSRLIAGTFMQDDDTTSAVVGEGLARSFGLEVGDELVLYGQGYRGQTAAGLYSIAGIVRFPMPEMDKQLVYLSLPAAQQLFSTEDQITAWVLHVDTVAQVAAITQRLQTVFGERVNVRDWQSLSPQLAQQMTLDRVGNTFVMSLLYGIVGFGLFATLIMMTLERQREFAVMLATGMVRCTLLRLLVLESSLIAAIGMGAGALLALPILTWLYFNPIEFTGDNAQMMLEMGWEPIVPVHLSFGLFAEQIFTVSVLVVVCLLYPLWRAYRLDVVSSLKGGAHAH